MHDHIQQSGFDEENDGTPATLGAVSFSDASSSESLPLFLLPKVSGSPPSFDPSPSENTGRSAGRVEIIALKGL